MHKIMLDANAYDIVAADLALKADIDTLQDEGKLEAIYTHVEDGELALIPFGREIGQAKAVKRRKVGAGVIVLDYSRLDEDRFGTPEADELFNAFQTDSAQHVEDGMIAATALTENATLVTNDRRFRNRMAEHAPKVPILDGAGFKALAYVMLLLTYAGLNR